MFWVPVEHRATNSHKAIPALHILTGILNIIRSLKKINIDLLLVIEGIQSTLGNVGSNSKIDFIIYLSSSIMKSFTPIDHLFLSRHEELTSLGRS